MIKIKKAKISNSLFLSYEYDQTVGNVTNGNSTKSDAPIHDDLRESFRGFVPHFAFLCEEITEKQMRKLIDKKIDLEDSFWSKFKVSSFTIGGSGDSEGITISGQKQVESGVISFNTPFTKWSDDYKFINELLEVTEIARNEVQLYMEGKQAPKAQQEMGFEDFDFEDPFGIDEVNKNSEMDTSEFSEPIAATEAN